MALTGDRSTPRNEGDEIRGGTVASVQIYAGAIVMRNAAGFLTKGQTATGLVGVGRAEERVTGGSSNGDEPVRVRRGTFRFANSTSGDLITIADIGKVCFAVDDEQVAKTNGTGTRSPAGFVDGVDAQGVWVRFDEAMLRAWADGIALPT